MEIIPYIIIMNCFHTNPYRLCPSWTGPFISQTNTWLPPLRETMHLCQATLESCEQLPHPKKLPRHLKHDASRPAFPNKGNPEAVPGRSYCTENQKSPANTLHDRPASSAHIHSFLSVIRSGVMTTKYHCFIWHYRLLPDICSYQSAIINYLQLSRLWTEPSTCLFSKHHRICH